MQKSVGGHRSARKSAGQPGKERAINLQGRRQGKVLFAWEAGANLGHVFPMAHIAKSLSQDGIRCFFAVRDLAHGRLALAGSKTPLLQAPLWPEHQYSGNQDGQASYADILTLMGFGDSEKLSAMLEAWSSLLNLIEPDAVVADHCPALLPLLKARHIASVAVGTGYTMPPLDYSALPPLRADRGPLLPEQSLLSSLAAALAGLGLKGPASLSEGFQSNFRFIFSFPELDAYRSWRREPLHLPPEPLPQFSEMPLSPHLFVYAGPEFPDIEELAQALGKLPFAVSCFLRGAPKSLNAFLRIRGLTAYDQPPNLAELLPRVSHVLSQGGNFTCHAAMAAGRPHLILPIHDETKSNAETLKALGIARGLTMPFNGELGKLIEDFVSDASLYMKSRQWAMLIGKRKQSSGLDATVEAVRHCLSLNV